MSRIAWGRPPSRRNWGARIREIQWLGYAALVLENEFLRLGILAGKGSDVFELLYKPRDLDLVWLSAAGFLAADTRAAIGIGADPVTTFLDGYGGGWQEILPNGGSPSAHAGAPFALHAEVAQLPWTYEIVEDEEDGVAVRLTAQCVRTPLHVTKEIQLPARRARLEISEVVTNSSGVPVHFMWGHHLTWGRPFLLPGARIEVPDGLRGERDHDALGDVRRLGSEPFEWPIARSPDGTRVDLSLLPEPGAPTEMLYLHGFKETAWYRVVSRGVGVRVEWDARVMPYLWYWQEFGQTTTYPWYGRHWNVGLEPFSSWPTGGLERAVENGTALELDGSGELAFSFAVEASDES